MNQALCFALMVFVTIPNAIPAPKIRADLPSELSNKIKQELALPSIHQDSIGKLSIYLIINSIL